MQGIWIHQGQEGCLPHTPPSECKYCFSDHTALYKDIELFFTFMYMYIYVYIYICTYHTYVWPCHQHVRKNWKAHSFLLLLARTWFSTPYQPTPWNRNSGNLFLSHQPASQPDLRGQSLRNLFVMPNCWALLNTHFSPGATCHTLKRAGLSSGKLELCVISAVL